MDTFNLLSSFRALNGKILTIGRSDAPPEELTPIMRDILRNKAPAPPVKGVIISCGDQNLTFTLDQLVAIVGTFQSYINDRRGPMIPPEELLLPPWERSK